MTANLNTVCESQTVTLANLAVGTILASWDDLKKLVDISQLISSTKSDTKMPADPEGVGATAVEGAAVEGGAAAVKGTAVEGVAAAGVALVASLPVCNPPPTKRAILGTRGRKKEKGEN